MEGVDFGWLMNAMAEPEPWLDRAGLAQRAETSCLSSAATFFSNTLAQSPTRDGREIALSHLLPEKRTSPAT